MKRTHKIYQSIQYPYYYTNVVIDGKIIRISFESVSKRGSYYIYGKFGTSNPKVQKELEKSPAFNIRYRLIETKEYPEDTKDTSQDTPQDNIESPSQNDPNDNQFVSEVTMVNVDRVQEARDWLVKNIKEVTYTQVRNREMVLRVAREHKVKFPNLK